MVFIRLRRTFERIQWLPADAIRKYQEKRLHKIINHAYLYVPFYRKMFAELELTPSDIRKIEDLNKLPLLPKETLRKRGTEFVADNAVSAWQPHLRRLMINSGQIAVSKAKETAASIRKYRLKFLKGAASAVYYLALCFKEAGITDISFQAVFLLNEVLTPQYYSLSLFI